MQDKWEINRVSTPERIIRKIKEGMAQPVGIILFGVDCDFKNEVLEMLVEELPGFYHLRITRAVVLINAFKERYNETLIVLNTDESVVKGLRQGLAEAMSDVGAKTVVGIYARARRRSWWRFLVKLNFGEVRRRRKFNKALSLLEKDPPKVGEFDYLVFVDE